MPEQTRCLRDHTSNGAPAREERESMKSELRYLGQEASIDQRPGPGTVSAADQPLRPAAEASANGVALIADLDAAQASGFGPLSENEQRLRRDDLDNGPRKLKVLVVEDDFTSRVLLQSLLLEFGTPHVAVDGIEAIQAFCSARQSGKPYDLVCMDVRLPEMNGMEALERIRMIEKQEGIQPSNAVKIFMTTGVRDLKTVSSSFNALCDAYLTKPLDASDMIAELRQHGLIR